MAILTKAQLQAANSSSFPNNNSQAITPQILRDYNSSVIDTLVDSLDTGSFARIDLTNDFSATNNFTSISASSFVSASAFIGDGSKLTNITASVALPILDEGVLQGYATSMNFTGSNITAVVTAGTAVVNVNTSDLITTSSFNSFTSSINSFTASQVTKDLTLATYTASVDTKFTAVGSSTASLNAFTSSQETKNSTLATYTASVDTKFSTIGGLSASWDNTRLDLYTASQDTKNSTLASYTGSNDTKWSTLGTQSGSWITESETGSFITETESGSFLITASVNLNTITFTKGNNTTFAITVNTGSGGGGTADLTSLNAFTASQETKDTTLASVTSSLNSATASLFTSASLALVTASFDNGTRNLTFTKGNTTQFSVNIPDASGSAPTTIYDTVYTGESITKGDPLYISGSQGANPIVFKADAAVPAKMPVTYVSNQTIGAGTTTEAIILGHIEGVDLTGYTAGQSIYVAEGGGFSTSLPSGSNSITQLLGVVTKGGSGGKGLVLNPGPAQLPGLDTGKMWVGNGGNQPAEITTASFASSASFNSYTSSNDQKVNSLIAATGSYATTGSNSFNGNQIITGSVTISGSATTDLTVVGQIFVSSSATGGTTAPKITVSGSAGTSTINRNSISTRNTTNLAQLSPVGVFMNTTATTDEIGFSVDTGSFSAWAFGPGIYVNNPTDTYPAVLGFQNKANYTDGRVAVLTPLSASAGFTASLQNGYAWVGNSLGQNTQVATSSFATNVSNLATTGSNSFNGNQTITGSLILSSSNAVELTVIGNSVFTGSAFGNVVALSITSNTASMDLNLGNYFTLTLADTATTHISASNVQPGVSATLVITTGTNSSASLAPTMLQPSGSAYSATNGSAKKDVLSIVAVASGVPFVVSTKNMI